MPSYYGMDDQGQMRHIRLRESMEQWHVRCAEQGESIRRLRADVGTAYSRKWDHHRLKALEAQVSELKDSARDSLVATNCLTEAVAMLAALAGVDTTIAPVIDGQVQLPCPEHGGDCRAWPACTS